MSEQKRSTYLVDRPFQLKATGLIVGLTLLIGLPLGAMVLREAHAAVDIGREAVSIGQTANATNVEAVKQAELLNTRLAMEAMLRFGSDPKKLDELKKENDAVTATLKAQAATVKVQSEKLEAQKQMLDRTRTSLAIGVGGGIAALVLLVAVFGVLLTHRVAGPVHRMRQLFREVGDGKFSPFRPLREGDELQEFFAEFSTMVVKLKAQQKLEIEHLTEAIEKAKQAGVSDGSLYDLRAVRDAMVKAVEGKPSQTRLEV